MRAEGKKRYNGASFGFEFNHLSFIVAQDLPFNKEDATNTFAIKNTRQSKLLFMLSYNTAVNFLIAFYAIRLNFNATSA